MRYRNWIILTVLLCLSACTDAYEERGMCSYLGTCEMGNGKHFQADYCKDLGSCSDSDDPTEYTTSGKSGAPLGTGAHTGMGSGGSDDSQ